MPYPPREKKSLWQVISDLASRAFALGSDQPLGTRSEAPVSDRLAAYGIHPLPARGSVVTNELIDRLRAEEGV